MPYGIQPNGCSIRSHWFAQMRNRLQRFDVLNEFLKAKGQPAAWMTMVALACRQPQSDITVSWVACMSLVLAAAPAAERQGRPI